MKTILIATLILFLSGCAGKGLKVYVETSGEGVNAEKVVKMETDYQIENGFTMKRGENGYEIDLGSATTKDAEVGMMVELLRMMQAMMGAVVPGFSVPPPAPPQ